MLTIEKMMEVCKKISEDIKNDISELDGKPFNGKVIGEMFGCQAAAINSLTEMMFDILQEKLNTQI